MEAKLFWGSQCSQSSPDSGTVHKRRPTVPQCLPCVAPCILVLWPRGTAASAPTADASRRTIDEVAAEDDRYFEQRDKTWWKKWSGGSNGAPVAATGVLSATVDVVAAEDDQYVEKRDKTVAQTNIIFLATHVTFVAPPCHAITAALDVETSTAASSCDVKHCTGAYLDTEVHMSDEESMRQSSGEENTQAEGPTSAKGHRDPHSAGIAQQPPAGPSPHQGCPDAERTTVRLRNWAPSCRSHHIVELLNSNGFRGKYDFVYLPMNFLSRSSYPYAFVNFTSHENALKALQLNLLECKHVNEGQKLEVDWSTKRQGLQANVDGLMNNPLFRKGSDFHPLLFDESGERKEFQISGGSKRFRQRNRGHPCKADKSEAVPATPA